MVKEEREVNIIPSLIAQSGYLWEAASILGVS
jgi:hypothetical protein